MRQFHRLELADIVLVEKILSGFSAPVAEDSSFVLNVHGHGLALLWRRLCGVDDNRVTVTDAIGHRAALDCGGAETWAVQRADNFSIADFEFASRPASPAASSPLRAIRVVMSGRG